MTFDTKQALLDFEERKANPPERIDNSRLYAGSPMYYYCRYCNHISEVLPETHLERPSHICNKCQELISRGLLEN